MKMQKACFYANRPKIKVFKIVCIWVGSNEGYLLLQGVAYCTEITKLHEIILLSMFLFLTACFHAVKGIQLEPTNVLFK
jgi:hypothetical protein